MLHLRPRLSSIGMSPVGENPVLISTVKNHQLSAVGLVGLLTRLIIRPTRHRTKNFHLLSCLVIPLVIPMVHSTRRNYGDKKQLLDDLKSFELEARARCSKLFISIHRCM